MRCAKWQEALSAAADGEEPGVDARLLDAHVAGCADCRAYAAAIEGSRRRTMVREASAMPDMSRRVAKLNAVADRASRWGVVRALLVVVGLEVIVVSVPSLFGEGASDAHDARHLGAFTIAYGVALLVVAVRPARARTVLPVSAVLAGALLITAVVDLVRGTVPLVDETTHLPELASVVLVWLLAVPAPKRRDTSADASVRAALRVVDTPGDIAGETTDRRSS